MSHFSVAPTNFPQLRDPPKLEPRVSPQTPGLQHLDAQHRGPIYNRPPIEPDLDSPQSKEAIKVLENHVANRMPYIQFASQRLQEAMGIKNEITFDIPDTSLSTTPLPLHSKFLKSKGVGAADAGKGALAVARAGGNIRRDNGFGGSISPKAPLGMHVVDKKTGKGLREFLLQKGTEVGQQRTDLKSISFYDFTPDLRTGEFRNKMMGHYAIDGVGERCVHYEIEMPTVKNTEKGEEYNSTERWIGILISRPLVSLEYPSETTPPNFPNPVPSSWIIFAAPISHVTSYPESIETCQPTTSYPAPCNASRTKRICKRRDYDFSNYGIPIFEFSSTEIPLSPLPLVPFLSVDKMQGWQPLHPFEPSDAYTTEEYAAVREKYLHTDGAWDRETGELKVDGKGNLEMPSPYKGEWWRKFYKEMYEDSRRWGKIKSAMGRGKCRVVLRWEELEGEGVTAVAVKKRTTRSETKKRSSALASMGEVMSSDGVEGRMGGGLADANGRSRASAGRAAGRGVSGEKEKGNGRVKKR